MATSYDAQGQNHQLRDLQRQVRRSSDVERAMNRVRDLRSKHCGELLAAAFRCLCQSVVALRNFTSSRAKSAVCALMFAGSVALGGIALSSGAAIAQEKIAVAVEPLVTDAATDQARLAELGLSVTMIEQCEDAGLLWRAVRELVLPQRVSESIQQRILRRVWVLDPDIAKGSLLDSETN